MFYDLPRSRCVEKLLLHQMRLFIAKGRACFLPIAILLSLVAAYRIVWFLPGNEQT